MLKSKFRKFVIAFSIFVMALLFTKTNYANYLKFENNNETYWKIVITSDTKELNDTQEIKFKVQDNPNVVNGKIAPGLKSTANIEINISQTKVPVDIKVLADTADLYNCFKLTSKLNNEDYTYGAIKTFKPNSNKGFTEKDGKILLTLELEWIDNNLNNEENTIIGSMVDKISVPITLNIQEHI